MLHEFLCISLQGLSDPTVVCRSSCISPLLFCRLIKGSWTACRDCLMIAMSDWKSFRKNPTSWWMLNKQSRRTINGTGWWEIGWMFRLNHNSWPYFACCLQYVLLLGRRPRQSWTICRIWLKSTCRMGLRAVFFSRCIMMLNGLDRFWWFQADVVLGKGCEGTCESMWNFLHPLPITMLAPSLPSGEVGSICSTPRGEMHLEMFWGLTSLFFSPSLKIPRLMKLSPWFYLYFLKRFLSWRENLEGHHDCGRMITRVKCITVLWGRPAHQAFDAWDHVFDAIRQVPSASRRVWHVQLMENR